MDIKTEQPASAYPAEEQELTREEACAFLSGALAAVDAGAFRVAGPLTRRPRDFPSGASGGTTESILHRLSDPFGSRSCDGGR